MDNTLSIILAFAALLVFGGLLFVIITFTKRGPKGLDVEYFRCEWLKIEKQLQRQDEGSFQLAVLNADKLLDKALIDRGIAGTTMGERMKQMQSQWSNANNVWGAHKLRNQIAHESQVKVDYGSARRALSSFKQALKDVGAI